MFSPGQTQLKATTHIYNMYMCVCVCVKTSGGVKLPLCDAMLTLKQLSSIIKLSSVDTPWSIFPIFARYGIIQDSTVTYSLALGTLLSRNVRE